MAKKFSTAALKGAARPTAEDDAINKQTGRPYWDENARGVGGTPVGAAQKKLPTRNNRGRQTFFGNAVKGR